MKQESKTVVMFDLNTELTETELENFKREAKKSKAKNLTDHFLNITIRDHERTKEAV